MEPVKRLHQHFPKAVISIDTFHATVAHAAVEAGASIINDISGGQFDPNMLATAGRLSVPFICMHLPGTVDNMHLNPGYQNISLELLDYFMQRKEICDAHGIRDLVIDPGFGFGKTMEQNYELLGNLNALQITGLPILAGLSRKSMIYKTLGTTANDALNGTTVLNTAALLAGASILRVHDVKEAVEAVTLTEAIKKSASSSPKR